MNPIGVFDSGYGGLTVLREFLAKLPEYDYIYLGDNARAPYGNRSFHTVYEYTLQAVEWLFSQGCHLVILACNTASAKALRSIQQNDLQRFDSGRRVLGVIRPSVEAIHEYTSSRHVGVLGTIGTVLSNSYPLEINKLHDDIVVYQHACPMWVPLIENDEYLSPGADYFIQKDLNALVSQSDEMDTIILGCTHYPLIADRIAHFLPSHKKIISQGNIVAEKLADYLQRHPEMERKCSKNKTRRFVTTDSVESFELRGAKFLGESFSAEQIHL